MPETKKGQKSAKRRRQKGRAAAERAGRAVGVTRQRSRHLASKDDSVDVTPLKLGDDG